MPDQKKVNIKALVLGVLTEVGGLFALGSIGAAIMILRKPSSEQLASGLENVWPFFIIVFLFIGFVISVLAGFVAGSVAKKAEVLHALVVGGVIVIYTNILYISGLFLQEWTPLYEDWHWLRSVGADVWTVLCTALGGYLAQRRHLKKEIIHEEDKTIEESM